MSKTEIEILLEPRKNSITNYLIAATVALTVGVLIFIYGSLTPSEGATLKAVLQAGGVLITAIMGVPLKEVIDLRRGNKQVIALQKVIENYETRRTGPPPDESVKPDIDELLKNQRSYFSR